MAANDWVIRIVSVILGLAIAWLVERFAQRLTQTIMPLLSFLGPRIQAWTYDPILPEDLPPGVRRYFDRTGEAFSEQGFQQLEDVILQDSPRSYARFFVSPDEECLGSVVIHGGMKSFCCTSLADDGTYLETGTLDYGPQPPPESQVRLFRAPAHRSRAWSATTASRWRSSRARPDMNWC
jgi:hypothetical protein